MPDGQVSCTANLSPIREIDHKDPANCLSSENVQSFAQSHGLVRCEVGRAVPVLRRLIAPRRRSCGESRDHAGLEHLSAHGTLKHPFAGLPSLEARVRRFYPLWLPPDAIPLCQAVFSLMRDHYEGTE